MHSQGFVASDADAAALTKNLGAEGRPGQFESAGISGRDLDTLAGEILAQAKASK